MSHRGPLAEERLGTRIYQLANDSLRVLHDRKIPHSSANIDHLEAILNGVFVIDAKHHGARSECCRHA